MDVEDVDVIGLEFLERVADGHVQTAAMVAAVVGGSVLGLFGWGEGVAFVVEGELCGEHEVVAVLAGGEPFAYPGFGLFVLVDVCLFGG